MSINTIYFDEYGRRTGTNVETAADFKVMLPKRGASPVPQISTFRGEQRRPARRDNTDEKLDERFRAL